MAGARRDKVAKLYYEVESNVLTSGSDYLDLYDGIRQACVNLTGTSAITSSDCDQVTSATLAVEMNQDQPNAPAPEAPVCGSGQSPVNALFEGYEGSASGWSGSDPAWGPIDQYAKTGRNSFYAPDLDYTADYSAVSPAVTIPNGGQLHFDHSYGFEDYSTGENYDGGASSTAPTTGPPGTPRGRSSPTTATTGSSGSRGRGPPASSPTATATARAEPT